MSNEPEIIGQCPICDRDMWKGPSIDKHHMVPKCKGGKATEFLHKICHRKIHSIWTEKELEREFNNADKIHEHEEIQKFIKFVSKKEPDFYDKNEQHKRKK
jgi:hypothetical protein